jgi:hypothetical protein
MFCCWTQRYALAADEEVGMIWPQPGSCQRLKTEAAEVVPALHARLVFDLGPHQSREKSNVKPADFRVVLRQIVVYAICASHTRNPVSLFRRNRNRPKSGLVHNLDDLVYALDTVLADKSRNEVC